MKRVRLAEGSIDEPFAALRRELGVPEEFPPDVLAEAEESARSPRLPERDLRDVEFFTVDPPGSRDLDQAMYLERREGGFLVRYAIADVGAFVRPGGAVDREAHARGVTLYSPDARVPLHPPVLSEGAASLLEGQDRPAIVWDVELDATGAVASAHVERALVRSRAQLEYSEVAGHELLREIGELRKEREIERGGAHLPLPQQEVACVDGAWSVRYRAPVASEDWNAQISLLCGMAAAELMLGAGVGILRVVPEPAAEDIARLRASAPLHGAPWDEGVPYAEWVRGLDPSHPGHATLMHHATSLLRGASYVSFDTQSTSSTGTRGAPPEEARHFAIADEYAHVTAPLRRLADRYALECCLAACAGRPVPDWVRAALPALPEEMTAADRRASKLERAVVDLVEAQMLSGRVGETFDAVVVDAHPGMVSIADPAIRARIDGEDLQAGRRIRATLTTADPSTRTVRFTATA